VRINITALIAVAFAIVALFLPWLAYELAKPMDFGFIDSYNYSPFRWGVNLVRLDIGHITSLVNGNYLPKPNLEWGWYTPGVFTFSFSLLYLFAVVLLIQASFTPDSWSKAERRVSIAASNLLFLSVLLYTLLTPSASFATWTWWVLGSAGSYIWYLDLGFWLAIVGAIFAYASWVHPKHITLDIKIGSETFSRFRHWMPVGEWEKSATMALASFFVVVVFAMLYLFLA